MTNTAAASARGTGVSPAAGARQPSEGRRFTYRTARSGALVGGIAMAILVETIALHALFMERHPVIAWGLTLTSVSALWWILADYRAMGRGAIVVTADAIDARIGRRIRVTIPRAQLASAIMPSWRERPAYAADYLNATKPAQPNVLLTLSGDVRARLPGGAHRRVTRIGLHLDDPGAFVAEVTA